MTSDEQAPQHVDGSPDAAVDPDVSPDVDPDVDQGVGPDGGPDGGPAADTASDTASEPALGDGTTPSTPAELLADVRADTAATEPVPAPTDAAPPAPGAPAVPVPSAFGSVPAAEADPGRWGRVDDDGTVYVRDGDDERAIGSWQAGDAEEGLRHFARRFDDLRTEAELLVTRLSTGRGDAKTVLRGATALRERLVDAAVVGDLPALRARLDAVVGGAEQAGEQERTARAGAREEAVARKESLIAEAESLGAETTRWKHAGDRFAAMLDEWKAVKGIDRKTDDALWKRFSRARETFTRRRGAHFAELDRARTSARTRKEELVAEAESLVGSTDWGPTAGRYKELMVEWKAAGRTSKEADDTLWARFRGAQDTFFAARSAAFNERDAEFADNARAKEALLVEAARIDLNDVAAARSALRDVQERWDAVGKVPRERVKEFSARLKEVEDRIRGAVDRQWQRSNPETEARLAQFRSRVEQYESQAAKAEAAGDRRRAQEAERQAAQWREWLTTAEQSGG